LIYAELGVEPAEDGRVAIKPVKMSICEMMTQDCGRKTMPPLEFYKSGILGLDLVFSGDATGFGNQQFNTYGLNNPHMSKSAQNFRIFGLGNCDDGREGCRRVLGDNLAYINSLILADEREECVNFELPSEVVSIRPKVFIVDDVSKIRHGEHLANSGFCGCSRHLALRTTPKPPQDPCTEAQFREWLLQCHSHSRVERLVLSHNTVPGEAHARKCIAKGCSFGHGTAAETDAEQQVLFSEERRLSAIVSAAGKVAFSKWRMVHAHAHLNVQPAEFGAPFLIHHFDRQILDPLHYSELGVPKTPWKHGILVNASDDAREKISTQLAVWLHPLDCKRKDNNRVRAQKWYTGEKWQTLCAGKRGSPGGPVAIAMIVHIIAEDLQLRGVDSGHLTAGKTEKLAVVPAPKPKAATKRNANAANFAAANLAAGAAPRVEAAIPVSELPTTASPTLTHVPTAIELAADPADLAIIRALFGSRAQTIINALLSFDAYFTGTTH
jgi:hypothetical protein